MTDSEKTDTQTRPFSADEKLALSVVLDGIIPPSTDGRFPGAGTLGLEGRVEDALCSAPELKAMIASSLGELARMGREVDGRGLQALSGEQQARLLGELANGEHAVPPVLILQVFACYYQHPRVLEILGVEARPPHPDGYQMKENDYSLLEPVRNRAPMYRKV
jgi:hypothetical protein